MLNILINNIQSISLNEKVVAVVFKVHRLLVMCVKTEDCIQKERIAILQMFEIDKEFYLPMKKGELLLNQVLFQ
jgi:CxxC motif-containing protein